eukprot:Nk52_evm1s382 gene=Nk52_evmTU1s382
MASEATSRRLHAANLSQRLTNEAHSQTSSTALRYRRGVEDWKIWREHVNRSDVLSEGEINSLYVPNSESLFMFLDACSADHDRPTSIYPFLQKAALKRRIPNLSLTMGKTAETRGKPVYRIQAIPPRKEKGSTALNLEATTKEELSRLIDEIPNRTFPKIGFSSLDAYKSAVISLYVKVFPNSKDKIGQTPVIKKLMANYKLEHSKKMRKGVTDPLENSMKDSYMTMREVSDVSTHFLNVQNRLDWKKARDRLAFLLCLFCLMRGDTLRSARLSNTYVIQYPESQMQNCYALVFCMRGSKTNKLYKEERYACLRNIDVNYCPVGALALLYFCRFHLEKEPFPDLLEPSREWRKWTLCPSSLTEQKKKSSMCYTTHAGIYKRAFAKCGIVSSKVTHCGRKTGAGAALMNGAPVDNIHKAGNWSGTVCESSYIEYGLATDTMLALSGHNPKEHYYRIKRAGVIPSPKLQAMVFPEAEKYKAHIEKCRKQGVTNGMGVCETAFIEVIKYMAIVMLQDSVLLMQNFPDLHIWSLPLFKSSLFLAFKKELLAAISKEDSAEMKLSKAMPELLRFMRGSSNTMNSQFDQMRKEFRDLSTKYDDTKESLDTMQQKMDILLERDNELNKLLERHGIEARTVESKPKQDTSLPVPQLVSSSYRMNRSLSSIEDLVLEFSSGILNGPAIDDLEKLRQCSKKKNSWRKNPNEAKFFLRRKVIVDEVRRIAKVCRISPETVAQHLDKYKGSMSLDYFSKFLRRQTNRLRKVVTIEGQIYSESRLVNFVKEREKKQELMESDDEEEAVEEELWLEESQDAMGWEEEGLERNQDVMEWDGKEDGLKQKQDVLERGDAEEGTEKRAAVIEWEEEEGGAVKGEELEEVIEATKEAVEGCQEGLIEGDLVEQEKERATRKHVISIGDDSSDDTSETRDSKRKAVNLSAAKSSWSDAGGNLFDRPNLFLHCQALRGSPLEVSSENYHALRSYSQREYAELRSIARKTKNGQRWYVIDGLVYYNIEELRTFAAVEDTFTLPIMQSKGWVDQRSIRAAISGILHHKHHCSMSPRDFFVVPATLKGFERELVLAFGVLVNLVKEAAAQRQFARINNLLNDRDHDSSFLALHKGMQQYVYGLHQLGPIVDPRYERFYQIVTKNNHHVAIRCDLRPGPDSSWKLLNSFPAPSLNDTDVAIKMLYLTNGMFRNGIRRTYEEGIKQLYMPLKSFVLCSETRRELGDALVGKILCLGIFHEKLPDIFKEVEAIIDRLPEKATVTRIKPCFEQDDGYSCGPMTMGNVVFDSIGAENVDLEQIKPDALRLAMLNRNLLVLDTTFNELKGVEQWTGVFPEFPYSPMGICRN